MYKLFTIFAMTTIIVLVISAERYSAEKDTYNQLTINGRTNFIFYKDISVENVKIIKDEK